jgi:hypothetical protein
MTQQQHPITPPPELRRLWVQEAQRISPYDPVKWMQHVSEKAAQWGADQELEACCDTLRRHAHWDLAVCELVADRRPKPPSLKEQALAVLEDAFNRLDAAHENIIRRALEALPDEP